MIKILVVHLSALLIAFSSPALAVKTIGSSVSNFESLLGEREVICTIDFAAGSAELSEEAGRILGNAVDRIKAVDLEKKMIRIEGFSSPEGNKTNNYRLSIERARSVERFLRANHSVSLEHYISGFGPSTPAGVTVAGQRAVQIAIYDNPWGQEDIPVETAEGK
jgi:hypothetical protein